MFGGDLMARSAILENVIDKRIEIVMTENKAFIDGRHLMIR